MPERFSVSVEVTPTPASETWTIRLDGTTGALSAGGSGADGAVGVRNKKGDETVSIAANTGSVVVGGEGVDGSLFVRNAANVEVLNLLARLALLSLGSPGAAGVVTVYGSGSGYTIRIDGAAAGVSLGGQGTGGNVTMQNKDGARTIDILGEQGRLVLGGGAVEGPRQGEIPGPWSGGAEGEVYVRDARGLDTICLLGAYARMWLGANGQDGHIYVRNAKGEDAIHLDGQTGDIVLLNGDCAEDFTVENTDAAEPGTVMVIGDDGKLRPSERAYDTGVIGVVAGAGNLRPGIVLDRRLPRTDRVPVSLMGKVFCKADATHDPIKVGDLLTTSSTTGHAMRAERSSKAFGAVIGKALAGLSGQRGLVPVLISLQ